MARAALRLMYVHSLCQDRCAGTTGGSQGYVRWLPPIGSGVEPCARLSGTDRYRREACALTNPPVVVVPTLSVGVGNTRWGRRVGRDPPTPPNKPTQASGTEDLSQASGIAERVTTNLASWRAALAF